MHRIILVNLHSPIRLLSVVALKQNNKVNIITEYNLLHIAMLQVDIFYFFPLLAFCPYHIGHFSVVGLGFEEYVRNGSHQIAAMLHNIGSELWLIARLQPCTVLQVQASHFEGLITTIVGYILLAMTLILCHVSWNVKLKANLIPLQGSLCGRRWSLISASGTGCSGQVPALPASPGSLLHRRQGNASECIAALCNSRPHRLGKNV